MTILGRQSFSPAFAAGLLAAVAAGPALSQERLRVHEFPGGLQSLTFSTGGQGYAVSVASNESAVLFDAKTGGIVRQLNRALGQNYALAYGPVDRVFASAVTDRNRDGVAFIAVRGWDVATGKKLFDLSGHNADIVSIAFSPDGKIVASGQRDGKVRLWRLKSQELLATLDEHTGPMAFSFTRDGREFITAGDDGKLILWDTTSFKPVAHLEQKGGRYRALSLSETGTELFVADGNDEVQRWDMPKRKRTATIKLVGLGQPVAPADGVMAIVAGPRLTAAAVGRSVLVWDIKSGQLVGQCEHPRLYDVRSISISPDGKTLLTGATDPISDKTEVVLWSLPPRR
jgi:WD40 repeat protein